MLPEKAWFLAPVLVVLKCGLALEQTAQAGVSERAVQLLLADSCVHFGPGSVLCKPGDLLVPLAL